MKKNCLLILTLLLLVVGAQKSHADVIYDKTTNTISYGGNILYSTGTVYWHADTVYAAKDVINETDQVLVPFGQNTTFSLNRGEAIKVKLHYWSASYSTVNERISAGEADTAIALQLSPEYIRGYYGDSLEYHDFMPAKKQIVNSSRFVSESSGNIVDHSVVIYAGGEYKFQMAWHDSTQMKQGTVSLSTPEQVEFFSEGIIMDDFLAGAQCKMQLNICSGYPWIDKIAKYTGDATWKVLDNQKNVMVSGTYKLAADKAREKVEYVAVVDTAVTFTPLSDFSVEITYPDGTVSSYPYTVKENPSAPVANLGSGVYAIPRFRMDAKSNNESYFNFIDQNDTATTVLGTDATLSSELMLYHPGYMAFNASEVKPVTGTATITDPYGKELVSHSYAEAYNSTFASFAEACKAGEANKSDIKGCALSKAGNYTINYTLNVDGQVAKTKSFVAHFTREANAVGKTDKYKNQVKVGDTYTVTATIYSGYPYSVARFSSDSTVTFKMTDTKYNVVATQVVKLDALAKDSLLEYTKEVTLWTKTMTAADDSIYLVSCTFPGNIADINMFNIHKIEPTTIEDVKTAQPADNRIYNLMGVYMGTDINALPQGIYIMNRKKIAVR